MAYIVSTLPGGNCSLLTGYLGYTKASYYFQNTTNKRRKQRTIVMVLLKQSPVIFKASLLSYPTAIS